MLRTLMTITFTLALSACQVQDTEAAVSTLPVSGAVEECVATAPQDKPAGTLTLDEILAKLRQRTRDIKSYQAEIEYLFIQEPDLLDSRTLRKGFIYYQKDGDKSRLRVNFNTIQQDDGRERKRLEQFLFDGVWLTKVDHELQTIDLYQQAQEDDPQDVFEYISHNFPIVGFSSTETLRQQFDISIKDQPTDPSKPIQLHLQVKRDSVYKDDYRDIDFSIDGRSWLPLRIVTRSTQEDVYDIQFLNAAVNKNLKNSIFVIETPKSFSKNIHPLQKDREREQ